MTGMIELHPIRSPALDRPGLFDHSRDSLESLFTHWGESRYRAQQVLEWVYKHGAVVYTEMTNIPRRLREKLAVEAPIYESQRVSQQDAEDGTTKLLLAWADGATTECVLIPDDDRYTACLSTQVGCPVGCTFCASGVGGLERQLTAGQIVEQALRLRQLLPPKERLTNVVFMGTGEPLANYSATVSALRTLNADWGLHVAARKITVSTVGLPSQMRRLADEGLQVTLALSLHAPTDELRQRIIPWAERVSVAELIDAGRYYFEQTGREVTVEYVLLGEVNDRREHADALVTLCRQMRSNVNLIVYNPVPGLPHQRPAPRVAERFLDTLRAAGVNTHLRRSRGQDVDGACGQLRRQLLPQPKPQPNIATATETDTYN